MTTDLRAGRKALQNATQLLNAAFSKGRHGDIARWLAMGAYYLGFLHCGGEISLKQYPFGETSDDPDEAMFLSAMRRAMQKEAK